MTKRSQILVALVALMHFGFAVLEIGFWDFFSNRIFPNAPSDLGPEAAIMAANQGIYNTFLAAGLSWALFISEARWQRKIAICFLLFVIVAAGFLAVTIQMTPPTPPLAQGVPAIIALISVLADKPARG